MTERPPRPSVDPDDATLAPGEQAALDESVRPVGARGRGATIAAVLIVLAFVVGLVRPWDWLAAAPGPGDQRPVASGATAARTGAPTDGAPGPDASDGTGLPADQRPAPTCGYPTSWRSATIQTWAGRRARVWTAVDVAPASDPADPAIDFQVVAGEDFTAIGWCAPVDRRRTAARRRRSAACSGSLTTATAVELPYARLEPPASSALGELWVPAGRSTHAGGRLAGRALRDRARDAGRHVVAGARAGAAHRAAARCRVHPSPDATAGEPDDPAVVVRVAGPSPGQSD